MKDHFQYHLLVSFPDKHKLVQESGKQIVDGVQHELITQIEVFKVYRPVILSHGSRSEHKPAGAQ